MASPKAQKKGNQKKPSAHLSTVLQNSTADEKKEAKLTIDAMDDKKKKSSLASMVHFLKLNPDETCQASKGRAAFPIPRSHDHPFESYQECCQEYERRQELQLQQEEVRRFARCAAKSASPRA